jgi:hypothetical protein
MEHGCELPRAQFGTIPSISSLLHTLVSLQIFLRRRFIFNWCAQRLGHYPKPAADFRDEVTVSLSRRTAAQLIDLCQSEAFRA